MKEEMEKVERNMVARRKVLLLLSSFIILFSLFIFNFSANAANPPAAVTPYTFLGRVMDATHKAFDGDRTATIEVADDSGNALCKTKTFFRADSRRNYVLAVPLATASANGYAVQNDALEISVTDDIGKVWSGVVVGATAGAAGALREVDIVLGEDANGDGIDDELYAELKAQWEDSDYWRRGETFDPKKDYDGDGVSTITEALSGTNPFDPEDVLKITAFTRNAAGGTRSGASGKDTPLTFDAIGGHAYSVEEATDLTKKDWKPCMFTVPGSDVPLNFISIPADAGSAPSTVYLLPSSSTNAFFRVRAD